MCPKAFELKLLTKVVLCPFRKKNNCWTIFKLSKVQSGVLVYNSVVPPCTQTGVSRWVGNLPPSNLRTAACPVLYVAPKVFGPSATHKDPPRWKRIKCTNARFLSSLEAAKSALCPVLFGRVTRSLLTCGFSPNCFPPQTKSTTPFPFSSCPIFHLAHVFLSLHFIRASPSSFSSLRSNNTGEEEGEKGFRVCFLQSRFPNFFFSCALLLYSVQTPEFKAAPSPHHTWLWVERGRRKGIFFSSFKVMQPVSFFRYDEGAHISPPPPLPPPPPHPLRFPRRILLFYRRRSLCMGMLLLSPFYDAYAKKMKELFTALQSCSRDFLVEVDV